MSISKSTLKLLFIGHHFIYGKNPSTGSTYSLNCAGKMKFFFQVRKSKSFHQICKWHNRPSFATISENTFWIHKTRYLFRLFTKAIIRHRDKNVREVISLQYAENITGTGVLHLNFSTPLCKMWIIQEPKKIPLWNKRHFEEKKQIVCSMFKILSTYTCWKKYIKCNIWRVALRLSYI